MKKIAVITVNFNSDTETHACLASLDKTHHRDFETTIIVVDNGSATPFVLTKHEKEKGIILLRSEKNVGFTGGNNLGIHYALQQEFDYLLLINNDTIVDPDCIAQLLLVAESDPAIGLVAPKIYFAKGHEYHKERYEKNELGKVIWYAGGEIDWKNVMSKHIGVDEVDAGQYDTQREINFVSGCCMFFKREVLEKIKGFDDHYFLYYEDADITLRTKQAGYKVVYAPKAILWHLNSASSDGSGSALHDYFLTRNRMLLGMKYADIRLKLALMKESIRLFITGRTWQKKGIKDFYLHKLGRGSFNI